MTDRHEAAPARTGIEAELRALGDMPPPDLPATLTARLMADALAAMPQAVASAAPAAPARDSRDSQGWLVRLGLLLDEALARAPGVAGLAAAGLAGVWIGFAPPTPAEGVADLFWQGAAALSPAFEPYVDNVPDFLLPDADFAEVEP